MSKLYWYILLWVWDAAKGDYFPRSESFYNEDLAKAKFDGVRLTNDIPQKELYKVENGDDTRLGEWVLTETGEYCVENV